MTNPGDACQLRRFLREVFRSRLQLAYRHSSRSPTLVVEFTCAIEDSDPMERSKAEQPMLHRVGNCHRLRDHFLFRMNHYIAELSSLQLPPHTARHQTETTSRTNTRTIPGWCSPTGSGGSSLAAAAALLRNTLWSIAQRLAAPKPRCLLQPPEPQLQACFCNWAAPNCLIDSAAQLSQGEVQPAELLESESRARPTAPPPPAQIPRSGLRPRA